MYIDKFQDISNGFVAERIEHWATKHDFMGSILSLNFFIKQFYFFNGLKTY